MTAFMTRGQTAFASCCGLHETPPETLVADPAHETNRESPEGAKPL